MGILFSMLLVVCGSHAMSLESKNHEYKIGDKTYEGYVAYPKGIEKRFSAILMIHNWMGVTQETKEQANRFAEQGYFVFAADVYGKGVRPKDSSEAGAQATIYKSDRALFRKQLKAALAEMNKFPQVNKSSEAAVGYCFGGTGVMELARSGAPLKGFVSFHGGLDSLNPKEGAKIKGRVLALHGAIDPFVKPEDLAAFEKEMNDHNVDYQLVKYGGTVHSFTDKGAGTDIKKGAAYNKDSDRRSFQAAQNFLHEIF
ncbi:MAG: dienelactone hydrolase family protein [Bdellovibrionales bacterium]|nr:dienelactone hydrolase family protein [Bdellovibrionales bacterium]